MTSSHIYPISQTELSNLVELTGRCNSINWDQPVLDTIVFDRFPWLAYLSAKINVAYLDVFIVPLNIIFAICIDD